MCTKLSSLPFAMICVEKHIVWFMSVHNTNWFASCFAFCAKFANFVRDSILINSCLGLVAATARAFNITDEEVLEAVVNESDELAHICELYNRCKMAS